MSETYAYVFKDDVNGATDAITITVSTPEINLNDHGEGYPVTGISGSVNGNAVTGEVGPGGDVFYDGLTYIDNTIFAGYADGNPLYNGYGGNTDGLDEFGIEFTAGGDTYKLSSDGDGDLDIYDEQSGANDQLTLVTTNAPCYTPDVLILTERGEFRAGDLAIGDRIVVRSGGTQALKWIGRRSYTGRLVAGNPNVWPILFKAGALADGVPNRDLTVSPEHALFLDGALVPAGLLVNGRSIQRVKGLAEIHYVHFEFESHEVILAEGAWAESFVDDASRGLFHNAAEYRTLYPSECARLEPATFFAPRIEDGFKLEKLRRMLNARAGRPVGGAADAAATPCRVEVQDAQRAVA